NNINNPVLPGDFADPSIVKVNNDYWATATSSEWAPEFPILHSTDMVNWKITGAVFDKRPDWTTGNFWAPEISHYKNKFYVYYTAHKKDGPLCVAVASSNKADSGYKDHGPLVCEDAGSIDAQPISDNNGDRYLVWKEDGNSRNQATPIWAQKFSDDGTKLTGEKKELFRNDPKTWEGNLVEAPFIKKHNNMFYMFYSGNACCGTECNYAMGVARAKNLLGPWEKNPANPILKSNDVWKCPGHGSIATDHNGKDFMLYHAYNTKSTVFVGRQGLLDEVVWNNNDWPTINNGNGPSSTLKYANSRNLSFNDEFNGKTIDKSWQWPQNNEPGINFFSKNNGSIQISSKSKGDITETAGLIGHPTSMAN
ncbi:glycoside hydrolase, partial [bacterium]